MHRDVSIGNILYYDDKGKLADLEYAKKTTSLASHELRTASESPISLSGKSLIVSQQGTIQFISVEATQKIYIFAPLPDCRMSPPLFLPNHLHDLESLWWVANWVAFYNHIIPMPANITKKYVSELQKSTDDLLKEANKIFIPTSEMLSRRQEFLMNLTSYTTVEDLPWPNNEILTELLDLRGHLCRHYRDIEITPGTVDPSSSDYEIYDRFTETFSTKIQDNYKGFKLIFIPGLHKHKKVRPRSESPNGIGVPKKVRT